LAVGILSKRHVADDRHTDLFAANPQAGIPRNTQAGVSSLNPADPKPSPRQANAAAFPIGGRHVGTRDASLQPRWKMAEIGFVDAAYDRLFQADDFHRLSGRNAFKQQEEHEAGCENCRKYPSHFQRFTFIAPRARL
jgi:hypothetical protein